MVRSDMTAFPQTLKAWRAARRYSQLDLALEAEISARHLSFLETGRARPSREMVAKLSAALDLPLEARNQLLTHAGFAARYAGRDWEAEEMAPIRQALRYMVERHMPYPALALSRLWRIEQANGAAQGLFGAIGVQVGDSLLDVLCSDALPSLVENWAEVAHQAAARLRVESHAQGGVPELDRAAAHLASEPAPEPRTDGPVIPTRLRLGANTLSMFATIAQFGTPEDLALADLKIELYFPMDTATEQAFRALAQE